jgi:hypothetical protein
MTTVLTVAGLWILVSVVLGLLIGRGINALRAVEEASCSLPPIRAMRKPASDRNAGANPQGRPQVMAYMQRPEHTRTPPNPMPL